MLQCSWISLFQEGRNTSGHRKRNGPEIRTRTCSRSISDNTVMKLAVKRSDGSFRQARRRKNLRGRTAMPNFQRQRCLCLALLQQHLLWPKISRFVDALENRTMHETVSERAAFRRTAIQFYLQSLHTLVCTLSISSPSACPSGARMRNAFATQTPPCPSHSSGAFLARVCDSHQRLQAGCAHSP